MAGAGIDWDSGEFPLRVGVSGRDILYVSLETPTYFGQGLDALLRRFQRAFERAPGTLSYVFFDEIQYQKGWEVHLKSLVDTQRGCRFVATGSAAAALKHESAESGAGRFTEFVLPPLTADHPAIGHLVETAVFSQWLHNDAYIESLHRYTVGRNTLERSR